MKFGLQEYFNKTPALVKVTADAFLGAASVYTVFGVQPNHLIITAAVVLKILSQLFGKK
jgi:hypothetical protein